MNFLCHVNCCNNRGVIPGVTYHKFPKNVAELWFSVHNIPIRKVENNSEMIVCSDHFKLDDYVDTKLKNGAIPSLHLKISKDEPNVACFPNNKGPNKLLNVTVLQKNNDPTVVEKFMDKNMEFTDIIAITDESDMLTAIKAMHNYSIPVQTRVNTNEQSKLLPGEKSAQVRDYLLNEKHNTADKEAPCFKNERKLRNKKESIQILQETNYKVNEEELIENIILDHDYTIPDELPLGKFNGTAYNIICSENYVWKLKKQLGRYSKKTRSLRKRLDSLKSTMDVLKKQIL